MKWLQPRSRPHCCTHSNGSRGSTDVEQLCQIWTSLTIWMKQHRSRSDGFRDFSSVLRSSTGTAKLAQATRVQPLGCSPAIRNWHADLRLIRSTVCPLLRVCYQHHRHPRTRCHIGPAMKKSEFNSIFPAPCKINHRGSTPTRSTAPVWKVPAHTHISHSLKLNTLLYCPVYLYLEYSLLHEHGCVDCVDPEMDMQLSTLFLSISAVVTMVVTLSRPEGIWLT